MEATTYQEVQGLSRMTVGELRDKYLEVFGKETRSYHKEFLRKRIAWRIQANAEGGLSERARRMAEEIANDAALRLHAPKRSLKNLNGESTGRTAIHSFKTNHDRRLPMPGAVRLLDPWVFRRRLMAVLRGRRFGVSISNKAEWANRYIRSGALRSRRRGGFLRSWIAG